MHPKVLYFLLDHSRKTMLVEWENALLSRHGIECPKRHEDVSFLSFMFCPLLSVLHSFGEPHAKRVGHRLSCTKQVHGRDRRVRAGQRPQGKQITQASVCL